MTFEMQGKRTYPVFDKLEGTCPVGLSGEYYKVSDGGPWLCVTPNGLYGNISGHTIEEHSDGTITVSPSILVTPYNGTSWHGYLRLGKWYKC